MVVVDTISLVFECNSLGAREGIVIGCSTCIGRLGGRCRLTR
jgi:hypothetical protein